VDYETVAKHGFTVRAIDLEFHAHTEKVPDPPPISNPILIPPLTQFLFTQALKFPATETTPS
jgi:hypothetical protein